MSYSRTTAPYSRRVAGRKRTDIERPLSTADERDLPTIEQAVRASVATSGAWFRLNTGREVFDIVPRTGWHKGAAVKWILKNLAEEGSLPIYLGDDNSDEDAFAVLTDESRSGWATTPLRVRNTECRARRKCIASWSGWTIGRPNRWREGG
ncbi:MAG: trehalose-phosphatase [Ignavibacteriota bacterium]